MKSIKLFTLSILLTFSALESTAQFTKKTFGHVFSLDVPDYMTKTVDLNSSATAQYQNAKKETYLILIEDSKEELELADMKMNKKDFFDDFIKDYSTDMIDFKIEPSIEFTKNGLNFIQSELTFKSGEVDIYMIVTVIESNTYYYKLLTWTLKSYKNNYKKDFEKIINSFSEN